MERACASIILTHLCKHVLCVSSCVPVCCLCLGGVPLSVNVLHVFAGQHMFLLAGACGLEPEA